MSYIDWNEQEKQKAITNLKQYIYQELAKYKPQIKDYIDIQVTETKVYDEPTIQLNLYYTYKGENIGLYHFIIVSSSEVVIKYQDMSNISVKESIFVTNIAKYLQDNWLDIK